MKSFKEFNQVNESLKRKTPAGLQLESGGSVLMVSGKGKSLDFIVKDKGTGEMAMYECDSADIDALKEFFSNLWGLNK